MIGAGSVVAGGWTGDMRTGGAIPTTGFGGGVATGGAEAHATRAATAAPTSHHRTREKNEDIEASPAVATRRAAATNIAARGVLASATNRFAPARGRFAPPRPRS